jgi:O-antigen ligase
VRVTALIERAGLRGGDHLALALQLLAALVIGLVAALVVERLDPVVAVGIGGGIILVLLGTRWPLVPLFVFVALVPIEETVNIAGLGTLSRWSGIVFAAVYAIPRLGRLTPGAFPLAGWAYIGWAVLSLAWALDPDTAQAQLQTLVQLTIIGFLLADVVIHDPSVVRPLLWTYSISAAAAAALGVLGYLTGGVDTGRLAAIANQNPAQFASILLPALIFGLYELLQGRQIVAGGLVSLVATAGIALSGTRSVWLAATVVVVLLVIPRLGTRRAILALVAIGILVLVTVQIPGVASLITERTETAASSGGSGRTDIWSVGLKIFESSPLIGVGYANFPTAFTASLLQAANVGVGIGTTRAPHNIVVGTAGELGLVGVILLALFIGPLVVRRGWGPDGLMIQAMLAALMIDALFIDILGNRKQVWMIIGMASGLAYLARGTLRVRASTMSIAAPALDTSDARPGASAPSMRGAGSGAAPGGGA